MTMITLHGYMNDHGLRRYVYGDEGGATLERFVLLSSHVGALSES